VTILETFTTSARRAVVAAGIGALHAGHARLGTDFLLLGLTEVEAAAPTLGRHGVSPATVRTEIDRSPAAALRRRDRELLATLGIDLDEIRRRAWDSAAVQPDDPRLWELRRSPVRPLRLTLAGPAGAITLTGRGRKVIEVASWAARKTGRSAPITGEHLLWGLLADRSNESVQILRRLGVDLSAVWHDLQGRRAA